MQAPKCLTPWLVYIQGSKSYYKTRNVCMFVCVLSPLAFRDRSAPNLAGKSGIGTDILNLMMAGNATFVSVCADESQAGNPIGSAL